MIVSREFYEAAHELYSAVAEITPAFRWHRLAEAYKAFAKASNAHVKSRLAPPVALEASLAHEITAALTVGAAICSVHGAVDATNMLREAAHKLDDLCRDVEEEHETPQRAGA